MQFPDQSHINQVRDALWRRSGGGASIMIGSGFSRDALKVRPGAKPIPLWDDLTREMFSKLYPLETEKILATQNPLRLAQEYKSAFGRSDLHRFLKQSVRDEDFKPGNNHTRLLKLPWRDVFTTNWDTLLERARSSVAERAYNVVRSKDEIPLANRPRIIKLHGSFPSYFPLIFTEEDYRTYPTKFAPFVNTAQQAMMESVFCLIGFSGDDPNFLSWSGWVRDNLGTAAPKIYLAGYLKLSSHRRRMLEDRNVVPIDLERHPKAGEWPDNLIHHYATEWFLHTLEQGQPYDVTNWPSPKKQTLEEIPTILEPIEYVKSETPLEEPSLPSSSDKPKKLEDSVRQVLKIWVHNRGIYPGWIVAPSNVRLSLSWKTDEWEDRILKVLPNFGPVERLHAIRELVWQLEILLKPISPKLESAAQEVLKSIDCQNRTIEGNADPEIEWAEIREAWRTIALALVTVARHHLEHDVFEQRIEALSTFLQDNPDVDHRIRHERCLWAIYSMDFEKLESLLQDWIVESCDPIWMMRKAALLTEIGQQDEATELQKYALTNIRGIPTNERSVAAPSREGWSLYSMWQEDNWEILWRRWDELAPLKCNAWMEKQQIADALKSNEKKNNAPSFDLGIRQSAGVSFSNENYNRWVSARRAIHLSEVAGLPPTVNDLNVAVQLFALAADELSTLEPEMAIRLVLRGCKSDKDKTLMRVLSRSCVAALPENSAKALVEICISVIEYTLPKIASAGTGKRPIFWIGRMLVAMEALSRLVLRLGSERAELIFNKAMELYRNSQVAQEPWLTEPIRNLLTRSWETMSKARRNARVFDLLSAPIVGMDNFTAFQQSFYPDPGHLLQDDLSPPIRTDDNNNRWQQIVDLLVRGLHSSGDTRKRAARRVAFVALGERLTESESSKIAQALWSEEYTKPDDLPRETELFDWVFLLLPEPNIGLAKTCFKKKWLSENSKSQDNSPKPTDILYQVGIAIFALKKHNISLSLSEAEHCYLIAIIKQWSDSPLPNFTLSPMDNRLHEPTRRALIGLPTIISEIKIPESIAEKLYNKMQMLNESKVPVFRLVAGLIKSIPNRFDEFALFMRTGLASKNEALAENAATGLYHWLTVSVDITAKIQPPSDDLVREIGVMIATRRTKALGQALQVADWVFDEGSDTQKETIRDLTLQGLGYLAEELRYDRENEQDNNLDVPLLRWRSAQLARSMGAQGLGDAPAVARWLEIIKEDPLPEVRFVKEPPFARQPEEDDEA